MTAIAFRTWAISFLALFATVRISAADPIQITFDDFSPGLQAFRFYQQGFDLSSFDQPNSNAGSSFLVVASPAATTAPNIALAAGDLLHNLVGTFFLPVTPPVLTSLIFAWTDRLAFSVEISGTWRAVIYDERFQVLDELTGSGNQQVLFSRGKPDIQYFGLFSTTPEQRAGIDTVEFNTPVVPEPGTLLLVGSGVGLLLRRRRLYVNRSHKIA
jgi:PEP-CTERM motif-containing protein